MLFAGQISAAELVAAAVVAWLAALYQALVRLQAGTARLSATALGPLSDALLSVVRELPKVGWALAAAILGAPPHGRVRVAAPPNGTVATSSASRAVAIAAASLAPNNFIVAASFGADTLVVHRLVEQPRSGG